MKPWHVPGYMVCNRLTGGPYLSSFLRIFSITTLKMLIISAPKSAGQNPLILMSIPIDWPICPVNQNRRVLTKRVYRPNVSKLIKHPKNFSKRPIILCTNQKMSASHNIETRLSLRSTPGTIRTTRYRATALMIQRRINFVISTPFVIVMSWRTHLRSNPAKDVASSL